MYYHTNEFLAYLMIAVSFVGCLAIVGGLIYGFCTYAKEEDNESTRNYY